MRVLVACEFSGIVRDAFIQRGHDAVSCDIQQTERPGPHIRGSVLDVLNDGWDLMIAHPPCTYLCKSGVRWLYGGKGAKRDPIRWKQMESACEFFNQLKNAPIPKIALENPTPHRYAEALIGTCTQAVNPWKFGHPESKRTCLWLKNVPRLEATNVLESHTPKSHYTMWNAYRSRERSRTLTGLADAMSNQWGIETPDTRNELWSNQSA